MPWSSRQRRDGVLYTRHIAYRTAAFRSAERRRLSPLVAQKVIPMTTTIHISGLNTQPASLIHPASDSRLRFCPRTSLLTWWLTFGQVGLESLLILTHWVTISSFIPPGGNPNDLSLTRHDQAFVMPEIISIHALGIRSTL